jgi:YesN/AraC family two-component response regulator
MGIMQSISSEIDSILRAEIDQAQKNNPALIVRSTFEVIDDHLGKGMSLEPIASAFQKHDIKVTKKKGTWCGTSVSCVKNMGLRH